jgi:hypothetical protein
VVRAYFVLVTAPMRTLGLSFATCALLARSAVAQPEPPAPEEPPVTEPPREEPKPAPAPVPAPAPAPVKPTPPIEAPPPAVEPPQAPVREFQFGSYGRVIAGSDLRGGKPESANVVAHGPRIVEESYLELDFSYRFRTKSGKLLRPVITLAFDGTLFHDTGNFDAQPALRNLFLDAEVTKKVTAWVGSRMYRGDDIYLFDYWPLDDLNTVGGGVVFRNAEPGPGGDVLELALHGGVNRLQDPSEFQFQETDVPDPEQGARTIVQLNRQRMVGSATASYLMMDADPDRHPNIKLKVHGEVHALPSGTRERRTDGTLEALPYDTGYLIGAQVGTWGFAKPDSGYNRHLNVFARYARGLAAFDELAPPTSFGADLKAKRASELTFGASAAWDHALGNVMFGALSRRFVDADANGVDFDDGWEYALDVRPLAKLGNDFFIGGDLSYQARFPRGLIPKTLRAEDPAVFQVAPMLVYSPMGPSAYDRPQIRLVYRAAYHNEAARDLFVDEDVRSGQKTTHFLGAQVEWWFNSSTYRR